MRLLHFDHSDRLFSTDFRGKTIPPYGILSHRWGDSEILIEDLRNETYKEKASYGKLLFCAKQAAQDGLQYFWIDTCCIDKWDVRERSRAINSMFRWYSNAAKCYVFLSDVSVSAAMETLQRSDWEASFRASDWFTRGWTLQDLIAPVSVEFFSCEGRLIGDKKSLEKQVHEITSIPLTALRNFPLNQFTTSERMQWAKNRKTTEEEDNVYCLLGVLSVSMPTSYGEGEEKALRRLQVEIEAASSAPSIIPYSQNDHFVGRESQLAELESKLFSDKQTTTMAIVGPGGTGKSQLALELAYQTRQRTKNCSVFWVDAGDIDSLYRSYASIAQKLNIAGWDDEKADVKQLVKVHLERKDTKQCLLIFDNTDIDLESSGLFKTQGGDFVDYLPQSELCSVVFTTTNYNTAKRLAPHATLELQELEPDTAQRMLENHLKTPIPASEHQEAKLLLQELSRLPLAIVQAAAYINASNITLQDYRSQLDKQKKQGSEHSNELSEDKSRGYDTQNPVATTLSVSMDHIRRHDVLAAEYLFLAACVDRKDVPLDLLEAASPKEREDAVKVLSRYALVTRRPADSSLDLHRLVHCAVGEWLQIQDQSRRWTQRAIVQLLRVFPDHESGSRSKWRRLIPHTKHALSHSVAELEAWDRLALVRKCAMALLIDGRYNEAEELFVEELESSSKMYGEEHAETVINMVNLACTYRDQGRWKEAEELFVRAIEMMKRVLGEEHPDTLSSIANLIQTFLNQDRWKEAEDLCLQVVETRRRVLGEEHPDTLISKADLTLIYRGQGRWKEAEELCFQVMETRKRVLDEEHPDTLSSMGNLAFMYQNQDRWKEARELGLQAMEMRMKVLGQEHPSTLISMGNLASLYHRMGWWKEAEELGLQTVETRKKVLGHEHPHTLMSMAILAFTLKSQGRDQEAISMMETCIQLRERNPNDHFSDADSWPQTLARWQAIG